MERERLLNALRYAAYNAVAGGVDLEDIVAAYEDGIMAALDHREVMTSNAAIVADLRRQQLGDRYAA